MKENNTLTDNGRNVGSSSDLPDLADVYSLAYKTIDTLPERFRPHLKSLLIRVENFADDKTLEGLQLKDKYDLLGLYRGVPLPLKTAYTSLSLPDIIFLYRCPLIRFARENEEDLEILVRHVTIHEVGHHFGLSDFEME